MLKITDFKQMISFYLSHKDLVDGEMQKFGAVHFNTSVNEWKQRLEKIENIFDEEKLYISFTKYRWKVYSNICESNKNTNNQEYPTIKEVKNEDGTCSVLCKIGNETFVICKKSFKDTVSIIDCLNGDWKNCIYKQEIFDAIVDSVYTADKKYFKRHKSEKASLIKLMINYEKEMQSLEKELDTLDKKIKQIQLILKDSENKKFCNNLNNTLAMLIRQKNIVLSRIETITLLNAQLGENKEIISYEVSKVDATVGKSKRNNEWTK